VKQEQETTHSLFRKGKLTSLNQPAQELIFQQAYWVTKRCSFTPQLVNSIVHDAIPMEFIYESSSLAQKHS
jgi:hypothetical protein